MLGVPVYWPEMITNRELRIRTGQEPTITTIRRRQWRWIGHSQRNDERNIACHGWTDICTCKAHRNREDLTAHGRKASRRTLGRST